MDGWTMIQAMPSNLNSYTDAAPPAGATSLYYRIEAVPNAGCVANRAVSHNTTRSNRTAAVAGPISSVTDQQEGGWLSLYPNPGNDLVTLDFNVDGQDDVQVFVYDLNGRKVFETNNSNPGTQGRVMINTNALEGGMYHVVLRCGNTQLAKRLIIQH